MPISQFAQAPSAPAAAAASSARVPRRQNAGRQGGLTYRTVEELVRGILRSLGELQPAVSDPASVRIDRRYLFCERATGNEIRERILRTKRAKAGAAVSSKGMR